MQMNRALSALSMCLLASSLVFGQAKPSFEVATIKPAQPLDPAKIAATLQSGGKLPVGADIGSGRAEYRYLDLRALMTYAYGVKPYQIKGPDWMATTRFDILAKMPEGATKDDAAKMLQSLLEDRFKLAVHHASTEQPVLALVAGKGALKLKPSTTKPVAIDETAPLKPGETKMDGPDGPVRVKVDIATGSSVVDMGLKGKMSYKVAPATMTMHMVFEGMTMGGLADMLTQVMTQLGGGGTGGKQIVDQTGIQGNYDASLELSLADIIALARAAGTDIPVPAGNPAGAGPQASDPGRGGVSVTEAVQSMGLKLESRKATLDQLVVDHIEKTPTEN